MFKKIFSSIKYIKFKDIIAIFIFIIALPIALIYKLVLKIKNKELWLICEAKKEACDNGYHLFKYIRTHHPEDNVYYAIDKKGNDYKKIESFGNIIQFDSFKHWIYYLSATKNISTHKSGNPNPPLFYFLHIYMGLFNNRVFLQHGITQNDSPWIYYKNTKFKLFVCGAKREYEYIKEKFGYPEENVQYLGFTRFDNLVDTKKESKQIVIMPTWRNWLGRETNKLVKSEDFINTDYYKRYNSLLNNKEFCKYIEKNNIIVYFYPHRNMKKYADSFNIQSPNIKVVTQENKDIQDLIKESRLMITDYSSVSMDFAYMKKPVIYYQFDKEEYRDKQLNIGYFKYEEDGFGPVLEDESILVDYIIKTINENYKIEEKYMKNIENFFEINDKNNCKRNYECIKSMK